MKELLILISCLFSLCLTAQKVKIIGRPIGDNKIEILIENETEFGQSVELSCELMGMASDEQLPMTRFLSAGEKSLFVTLKPKDIYIPYSYATSIKYVEGNITAVHDDSFVYHLPYPSGKSYNVDQGYFGDKTHQNKYALDFHMDTGSEVSAVRDGIVTKVVEKNDRGCPSEHCNQFNNHILITHSDGSIADYSHLKKNGAKVKVGDKVLAGDIIAISGATGWASGPHLHLEIYTMTWDGQKTIPAQYYLTKSEIGIPQQGFRYKNEL